MFRSKNKLDNNKVDISNYVDGYDLYNSLLLSKLTDPNIKKEEYTITTFEYRPDLISRELYGSEKYLGVLLFINALNLNNYTKGRIIKYIPKDILLSILNTL